METLLDKIEVRVFRNCYRWYYEEILESFPKIISLKFRKNYEEIFKFSSNYDIFIVIWTFLKIRQ